LLKKYFILQEDISMSHELSLADVAAVNGGGMNGEMWNNPFIYLVWLAVLGGGGLFGNRFGAGADPAVQGALTRSDLFEGFNNQDVNAQLRGITNGICDGFYAVNTGMKDGFYGIKDAICATNRNIDGVKYDIATAIHAEGEATRALINATTMQELREKLADKDRELLTANFQLSQQAQNAYLINEIRPCAKPAYITCSPYTTASFCGAGV
jgi:hypothetical protein